MDQLLLLFWCNFCSFFSSVGGVLVTNLFSLLLTDRYILAMQQIITQKEHLWKSFWSVAIFWIALEAWHLKVIFTKQFLTKTTISRCFDVFSVQPLPIFQVQAKTSTIRHVFPDDISVSHDYGFLRWSYFFPQTKIWAIFWWLFWRNSVNI